MAVRMGEEEKHWFRSERMMHINDKWYFVTREMTQEGPFNSKYEAEMELNLYIRHSNDLMLKKAN